MSSSPSSRRNGGTASSPPAPGSLLAAEGRDWAALPRDIVLDIFLRLGPREVMLGAEFACKPWRRVALEEPSLWRRVGMEEPSFLDKHWRRRDKGVETAMNLVAVDRAAGQCEAFQGGLDNEDLLNLVERAPSLKCLDISEYYCDYESGEDSGEDLVQALMKLPLLEELLLCFQYSSPFAEQDESMLQSVCKACPHLKKLILIYNLSCDDEVSEEEIDGEIPMMLKLHILELCNCDLKVEGLEAILESCPVLETLHIEGYFNCRGMDKELRKKCARVKNLTLPTRISADVSEEDAYAYYYDTDSEDDDSLEEY